MKKMLFFIFLILGLVQVVSADDTVHVIYGETYYCGDSWEVIIPDEPQTTTMVTRHPPGSPQIVIKSGAEDILMQVRVKVRNLSPDVLNGLSPESFQLVGYVRGRPLAYTPEVMAPFDYGSRESYTMYDKMYYRSYTLAPLRQIDMLMVYRINPLLRDWELHVNPQGYTGTSREYADAVYHDMDLEPCDGIFQFITIRDSESGEITKYYR